MVSLTSGTGSRAVGSHDAPAVVGLLLRAGQGVLPRHTRVLSLQENLAGETKSVVSLTIFLFETVMLLGLYAAGVSSGQQKMELKLTVLPDF